MTPEQTRLEILQKLMALHAWDAQKRPSNQPRLVDLLLQQWDSEAGCKPLEAALKKDPLDQTPPDGVDERLYKRLIASAPLRRQLVDGPLFSDADKITLRILVQLADVTPNREQTMMDSDDALFQRILDRWRQEPVTAEKLLEQDLARLLELEREAATVIPPLAELAAEEKWQRQMQALESRLENPDVSASLPPMAEQVWQAIKMLDKRDGSDIVADILLSQPRFSATLPLLVRRFAETLTTAPHDNMTIKELFLERPDELDVVMQEMQYRLEAADYFLALRKFAKLDALAYQWPDLYRRFNVQRSAVVEFEQYVNEPEATRDEPDVLSKAAQRLWEAYSQDEELVRFLQLRPLLNEIYKAEREKYQQVQAQTATVRPTRTEQSGLESLQDKSLVIETSSQTADAPEPVLLHIRPIEGEEDAFELTVACGDILATDPISIDWRSLYRRETKLLVHADPATPVEGRFRELGRAMFFELFSSETQQAAIQALSQGSAAASQRALIQADTPELHRLPWESLYIPPPVDRLISASSHFSVLRYVPGTAAQVYPETGPLRALVVIQAPEEGTSIDLNYERALVERTMDDAARFQVKYLENASLEAFQFEVQNLYPHVVHIVGQQLSEEDELDKLSFFINNAKQSDSPTVGELADILKQGQVKMITLASPGTPTRMMAEDEQTINAAVGLAAGGIPAVVAPTRTGIFSVPFHRTLYQALANGQSVEAAVLDGRRALKTENQPWIRYALFAGVREPVQLIVPVA